MRRIKSKKSAFTLVEILVVILIIGLLFVFLVPKIDTATVKARETGIKTDMRSYQIAIESVAREHAGLGNNAIPDSTTDGDNVIKLINGYLDPALKINYADSNAMTTNKLDPWNNPYLVDFIDGADGSNNGIVTVRTLGKDMRDNYDESKLDSSYTADGLNAISGDIDADLETARKGDGESESVDDYITGTWYIDGQIMSATAGFTTNVIAIKKTASAGNTNTGNDDDDDDGGLSDDYLGSEDLGGDLGGGGGNWWDSTSTGNELAATGDPSNQPGYGSNGYGDWTW